MRAFKQWPYPCIGQLRFLDLNLAKHPYYSTVLSRLRDGQTFLDAGCCFGQDLRKLIFDGAPSSKALAGLDVESVFLELGYDLFRDKDKFHGTLLPVDLLKDSGPIPSFDGQMDMIGIFSVLHFFAYEPQIEVVKRLVGFSRPKAESTILGRQVATPQPGVYNSLKEGSRVYIHDVKTFKASWERVGRETSTRWEVDAWTAPVDAKMAAQTWAMPEMCWLYFVVTRI